MSARIQCRFYKIGSIRTLFPNFIWMLLPTQQSQCKERNQGTGGDVSHLECQSRIIALSSDLCDQFHLFPSLPSVIKLSTLSWSEGTTHSDHWFSLGLFFLPLLLSLFWSRRHDIDLDSTWGQRRRSGWIKTLTPNAQGKGWCSWCLPWSSKYFFFFIKWKKGFPELWQYFFPFNMALIHLPLISSEVFSVPEEWLGCTCSARTGFQKEIWTRKMHFGTLCETS